MDEVRADGRQVEVIRGIDHTVEKNDRDLGFLGFLENGIPTGRNNRGDQDRVHALGDEGAARGEI